MSEPRLLIVPEVDHDEPAYTHRVFKLLHLPIGELTEAQRQSVDADELAAAQEVMGVGNLWEYAHGLREQDRDVTRHHLRPWLVRVALDITEPLMLEQFVQLGHGIWGIPVPYLREELSQLAIVEQLDPLLERFILWAEPRTTAYISAEWTGDLVDEVRLVVKALVEVGDERILKWGEQRVLNTLRAMRLQNAQEHLRDAIKAARDAHGLSTQPDISLRLKDVQPATEPVTGSVLLDDLVAQLERFVVMPPAAIDFVALWVLLTYVYDEFDVSAYATFNSPQERCGKTRVMTLVTTFARRSLLISNATPATIFRVLEAYHPVLAFDEFDSFGHLNEELRNILNAGHTRDGAFVLRCDGDENVPRIFHTFGPKAIALIGKLARTLRDRSIVVPMKRRDPATEPCERLTRKRFAELKEFADTWRSQAARWGLDSVGALRALDEPDVPTELGDRAYDNWTPLIAIAQVAGGDWPTRARSAALALSGAGAAEPDDQQLDTLLLADLRDIWAARAPGLAAIPSADLVRELVARDDRPWREYGKEGQPLSARGMAKLLERYGVRPKQIKPANLKGYVRADLQDSWTRYLSPLLDPKLPKPGPENEDLETVSEPKPAPPVSDAKPNITARNFEEVSVVSDKNLLPTTPAHTRNGGPVPTAEVLPVRTPMGPRP
jgi:hypothetical protein